VDFHDIWRVDGLWSREKVIKF